MELNNFVNSKKYPFLCYIHFLNTLGGLLTTWIRPNFNPHAFCQKKNIFHQLPTKTIKLPPGCYLGNLSYSPKSYLMHSTGATTCQRGYSDEGVRYVMVIKLPSFFRTYLLQNNRKGKLFLIDRHQLY